MKKDLNYIVRLEKAISKKYGEETIQNPMSTWTEEKERDYLEQIKKSYKKELHLKEKYEKVEVDGIMVPRRLLSRRQACICPICETYSLKKQDDLYMSKFACCFKCYIEYVEDREERWLLGWRPEEK